MAKSLRHIFFFSGQYSAFVSSKQQNGDSTALLTSGCSKVLYCPYFLCFRIKQIGTLQHFGDQDAQSAVLSLFFEFPIEK